MKSAHIGFLSLLLLATFASARTVEYRLNIAEEKVNITGKSVSGITINGGIPGPTLHFSYDDTAVMHVTNSMVYPSLSGIGLIDKACGGPDTRSDVTLFPFF